ncbi:hypothetical protein H4R35_001183 [Dimargaris xerosporica]|nr:hypothetical protein H4R35_001183 [Dimargaris xerosporica]
MYGGDLETARPPRGGTLRRGKTLIRPERQQAPDRMVGGKPQTSGGFWHYLAKVVTFWMPGILLAKVGGMGDKSMQQAWREKMTLCIIIAAICAAVVFLTLFFGMTFCSSDSMQVQNNVKIVDPESDLDRNVVNYLGRMYYADPATFPADPKPTPGQDITNMFARSLHKSCERVQKFAAAKFDTCSAENGLGGCPFGTIEDEMTKGWISGKQDRLIGYEWDTLPKGYFVINGEVVNLTPYLNATKNPIENDIVDQAIRTATENENFDATLLFRRISELDDVRECIVQKYFSGKLAKATTGCFAVNLFNYIALALILGLVLIKFFMALTFSWVLSHQLARRKTNAKPILASSSTPWAKKNGGATNAAMMAGGEAASDELFTVLLVTCYSEGESSIRNTVESLASTDYSDSRKLLFVIADGMITGSGNDRSTPDICIDLVDVDPMFKDPQPCSYIAIADGSKQFNMAKVYAGHYPYKDRRVPIVVLVKCGNPDEQDKPKAGNRGKRDSQIILMNFFSRVIYNDRMTPLDYDLFRKIHHLMGVTPDLFEIVLMVDADTKVYPDSLRLLVNCMNNDPLIMGLCGETKIANKRESWVTWIQVYEYYISHHLGKAFESVFGGVTCLPGCFCMYRFKAPKGDNDWIPIITKPEIIQEYSQNVVHTLHEKNLLLLGEDRFLTTLMLRNFPYRKIMFMPQAICKTVVPDEFKVLLSQRRRWINSTIHNLFELVLVRNLCGTFCISMQFVVFMDLIGTLVLPVAIAMTFVLIVNMFLTEYTSASSYLPLVMLIAVLFLPGVLILFTTRKWIYLGWMFVYLLSLPIWNFVLPTYAYWHFDDFSWGETRKVDGEAKGDAHGNAEGTFDASKVPLRRWEDYERRRLRSVRRKERRRKEEGASAAASAEDLSTLHGPGMGAGYSDTDTTQLLSGPMQHHPADYDPSTYNYLNAFDDSSNHYASDSGSGGHYSNAAPMYQAHPNDPTMIGGNDYFNNQSSGFPTLDPNHPQNRATAGGGYDAHDGYQDYGAAPADYQQQPPSEGQGYGGGQTTHQHPMGPRDPPPF